MMMPAGLPPENVVLVHGAFVDGSTWRAVYDLLTQDGYHVAATRQVIDAQDGPVVLVGHSYGGAVITEAGIHDKVAALAYIAAFAPDKGESVNTLIAKATPGEPTSPILPPADGFMFQDRAKFPCEFGGDLPAADAAFLADAQVGWGVDALAGEITEPAWRRIQKSIQVTTPAAIRRVVPSKICSHGSWSDPTVVKMTIPKTRLRAAASAVPSQTRPAWPPRSVRAR